MILSKYLRTAVPGYEGFYEVDTNGEIYSLERVNSRGMHIKPRKLKQSATWYGYKVVFLSKNGISKAHNAHRLVALAFVENKDNKPYVNHIDSNKHNNNVENLEWVTHAENAQHSANYKRSLKEKVKSEENIA